MARVLIVDDLRDSADALGLLFRMHGHETRCAYCGQEGVSIARDFKPQIVLLDILMPDLSGESVAKQIREIGPTVILAYTGLPISAVDSQLFDAVVAKPGYVDDLLALVKALTEPETRRTR